jgi:hypothetical protein
VVELRSREPVSAGNGDSRELGFCVYQISIDVLRRANAETLSAPTS